MSERKPKFDTPSGIPLDAWYGPESMGPDAESRLGEPGSFPFTRGIYPSMYRGRFWTMRQYAGFGTARETNERFRYLLDSGQTGLSVAFDLPTQMGLDSDDPLAEGEVGRVGVAIDTIEDMRILLENIPLGDVSTSMTINATASTLLAMYVAVADERGVDRARLAGTVQNDMLKEFVARGTFIYPVEPSLRLVTDIFSFCADELPRWNSISISGYHMREAGATAAQELAFTLANGREYVRRAIACGLELESFAPRLSFFFASHNHLLEEVAKFRAARRLWAHMMRSEFGASDRSCRLRFHTQTGGSTLTAQQPANNIVRVTVQALAAALGGTQSLHTNGYDEALALPTAESARLALRTQQVLAEESGVADTVDPLAGSYLIESLTDALERKAREYLALIDEDGGAAASIAMMANEIHRSAYEYQLRLEAGDARVVGVNAYADDEEDQSLPEPPDFGALANEQRSRLDALKRSRDQSSVDGALARIDRDAQGTVCLMPALIEAVRAGASLGEVSSVLQSRWGKYAAT